MRSFTFLITIHSAFVEISTRLRTAFMQDLVMKARIFEVASDGPVIAEKNGSSLSDFDVCLCQYVTLDDWVKLFKDMVATTRYINPDCDHRATPRFLITCQTKLERLCILPHDTLCKIAGSDSMVLAIWHRSADSVGISDIATR